MIWSKQIIKRLKRSLIPAIAIHASAIIASAATTNQVPLWVYLTVNLANTNAANNVFAHSLLDRAAALGYTGLVLSDSWLYLPDCGGNTYRTALQPFLTHASNVGISVAPLIYSFTDKSILPLNKNYAEGMPVIGASFTVSADKQALILSNSFPNLSDCGFENHSGNRFAFSTSSTNWSYQDAIGTRTFADTNVFRSGNCSFRVDVGTGLARLQKAFVPVIPWRQYHVSIWVGTTNYSPKTLPDVAITSASDGRYLTYNNYSSTKGSLFQCSSNQPWTQYNFFFNSISYTQVHVFVAGGEINSGSVWFDDITMEETALVNLVRRTGAPLTIYDASNTNFFYTETNDINTISDPAVPDTGYGGQFTPWHTPPTVTLPAGTSLFPGQQVKMNYYAVNPIYLTQVGACFTAPGIAEYMLSNVTAVANFFPSNTAFVMNYDENRHMNNCASCQAIGQTAGGLIGWHVGQAINTIHSVRPNAPISVWGDMFDPYQNAISGFYFFCNGPTAESWIGLPSSVTIMNWNHNTPSAMTNSLLFFSGRGHKQFIAGYYDSGNGRSSASNELKAAQGVAGFQGLMYTTFAGTNGYAQLSNYAAAAKAPALIAGPSNIIIDSGQLAAFSVSATAPTPLTFQWQRNGANILDATNAGYSFTAESADNGALFLCLISDYGGSVLTDTATLTVNPPLVISSSSSLSPGVIGVGYSQPLALTGGTMPFTWSVIGGILPGGLVLNTNGVLSGTPTTNGLFSFTALVTDAVGTTATNVFSLTIHDTPYNQWRAVNFTPEELADPNLSGPDADPDFDSFTNFQEYLAATDPKNSTSLLRISDICRLTNNVLITWIGGTGAWQCLESMSSLTSNQWIPILTNPPQSGITNLYIHTGFGVATNQFYRIKAWR